MPLKILLIIQSPIYEFPWLCSDRDKLRLAKLAYELCPSSNFLQYLTFNKSYTFVGSTYYQWKSSIGSRVQGNQRVNGSIAELDITTNFLKVVLYIVKLNKPMFISWCYQVFVWGYGCYATFLIWRFMFKPILREVPTPQFSIVHRTYDQIIIYLEQFGTISLWNIHLKIHLESLIFITEASHTLIRATSYQTSHWYLIILNTNCISYSSIVWNFYSLTVKAHVSFTRCFVKYYSK